MLLRIPIALVVGLGIYLVSALLTGGIDGIESWLLLPLGAVLITGPTVVLAVVLGSPLLIAACWERWRKLWLVPTLMASTSVILMVASWLPVISAVLINPRNGIAYSPLLFVAAWFFLLFALVWHPLIGLTPSRKWA